MIFSAEFPVRFGDIDQARVVYYPRFFHFYHRAFEDWFGEALGAPYSQLVVDENIGLPTVKIESEFRRPLSYGERVRIDLELLDIGKKSITLGFKATRLPDGEHSASATITKVAVDNDSFKSVTIPDVWRSRFETFMNE